METFTDPRTLVANPRYAADRRAALAALDQAAIDEPIVDIIRGLAALPHCFTLQSCHGHFVCAPDQDPRTLDDVPAEHAGPVRYRIAYLALCIQDSPRGRALLDSLARLTGIDPDDVQFGSADWFWARWVNSYALQVEPVRFRTQDEAVLDAAEARRVQRTRDLVMAELRALVSRELSAADAPMA